MFHKSRSANGGKDRCWHFSDKARSLIDFRFRWKSGRAADIAPVTGFDPSRTSGTLNSIARPII
jgi:hypothetical protein